MFTFFHFRIFGSHLAAARPCSFLQFRLQVRGAGLIGSRPSALNLQSSNLLLLGSLCPSGTRVACFQFEETNMNFRKLLGWSSALCLSATIVQAQETNQTERFEQKLKEIEQSFEKRQQE